MLDEPALERQFRTTVPTKRKIILKIFLPRTLCQLFSPIQGIAIARPLSSMHASNVDVWLLKSILEPREFVLVFLCSCPHTRSDVGVIVNACLERNYPYK